jgi:hypothetical protein
MQVIGPLDAAAPSLSGAQGVAEFTKGLSYHNSQHSRDNQFSRIYHRDPSSASSQQQQVYHARGWTQHGAEDYLEINLHYPRFVTHIGTAGQYPLMTTFPTRRLVGKRRMRSFRAATEEEENQPQLSQRGTQLPLPAVVPFRQHMTYFPHYRLQATASNSTSSLSTSAS